MASVVDSRSSPRSRVLFLSDTGKPMRFFLRPGATKTQLHPIIRAGGGVVCRVQEPNAILLRDPEEMSEVPVSAAAQYVSSLYILDCVEKNQQLELDDYKFKDDSVQIRPSKRRSVGSGRMGYSAEEDAAILRVVRARSREVSGNRLWKELERVAVTSHSWQSMKDRYRKYLSKQPPEGDAEEKRKASSVKLFTVPLQRKDPTQSSHRIDPLKPSPEKAQQQPSPEEENRNCLPQRRRPEPSADLTSPQPSPESPRPQCSTESPRPQCSPERARPQCSPENPRPQCSTESPRPQCSTESPRPQCSPERPRPQCSTESPRPQCSPERPRPQCSTESPRPQCSTESPRPQCSPERPRPQCSPEKMRPHPSPWRTHPQPPFNQTHPQPPTEVNVPPASSEQTNPLVLLERKHPCASSEAVRPRSSAGEGGSAEHVAGPTGMNGQLVVTEQVVEEDEQRPMPKKRKLGILERAVMEFEDLEESDDDTPDIILSSATSADCKGLANGVLAATSAAVIQEDDNNKVNAEPRPEKAPDVQAGHPDKARGPEVNQEDYNMDEEDDDNHDKDDGQPRPEKAPDVQGAPSEEGEGTEVSGLAPKTAAALTSKVHMFIFDRETQEAEPTQPALGPPFTQVQLEDARRQLRYLMKESGQGLDSVSKALLKNSGDVQAALQYLRGGAQRYLWDPRDDAHLVSAGTSLLNLEKKYGKVAVARRMAFLDID